MKKILFIADSYGATASANGICVKKVAEEFCTNGWETHILAMKHGREANQENIDGVVVHRISPNIRTSLYHYISQNTSNIKGKLVRYILKILNIGKIVLFPFFHIQTPILKHRYISKAENLHILIDFDIVVSTYVPMVALYAGEHLKSKFGVKFTLYFVDCITDQQKDFYFWKKDFLNSQGYKYEKKFFDSADLILNLECHSKNFSSNQYNRFFTKMKIVDIPFLTDRQADRHTYRPTDQPIIILYTGTIRKQIFPIVLNIFEKLCAYKNFKWIIYSHNSIVSCNHDFVIFEGQVDAKAALQAQEDADILVSMGNEMSNFIPSKIFEYMSTGKKIVHFGYGLKDSTYPYYSQYNNALNLDIYNHEENNVTELLNFIDSPEQHVSFNELSRLFQKCLPSYTYNTIKDNIT